MKNFSDNKAYIIGSLNACIFLHKERWWTVSGKGGEPTLVDPAWLSHLVMGRIEVKEIEATKIETLMKLTREEHLRHQVLGLSLEMMDPALSDVYLTGACSELLSKLAEHPRLILHIANRLYASPLPDAFQPGRARKFVWKKHLVLSNIYAGLSKKSELFTNFYTVLILALRIDNDLQQKLNEDLTENGDFVRFVEALSERSTEAFIEAAKSADQVFRKHNLLITADFFERLVKDLKDKYKITLSSRSQDLAAEAPVRPKKGKNTIHVVLKGTNRSMQQQAYNRLRERVDIAFFQASDTSSVEETLRALDHYNADVLVMPMTASNAYITSPPVLEQIKKSRPSLKIVLFESIKDLQDAMQGSKRMKTSGTSFPMPFEEFLTRLYPFASKSPTSFEAMYDMGRVKDAELVRIVSEDYLGQDSRRG